MNPYRVRKVKAQGTVSYQLGRYVMRGKPGYKRSYFEVAVHLGEHETPEAALTTWPEEIKELETVRPNKAKKLQEKLEKLLTLTFT